jgi:hypothetical protein
MRSQRQPFAWVCEKCGADVYDGFARCQNSGCRQIRPEFHGYESVLVEEQLLCVFCGGKTDVRLPNGDGIWAEYFLDFVRDGWIGPDLRYTAAFYDRHPTMRPGDHGREG